MKVSTTLSSSFLVVLVHAACIVVMCAGLESPTTVSSSSIGGVEEKNTAGGAAAAISSFDSIKSIQRKLSKNSKADYVSELKAQIALLEDEVAMLQQEMEDTVAVCEEEIKRLQDQCVGAPNPNPGSSLCQNGHVDMGSVQGNIWGYVSASSSCPGPYKTEGFSQCAGDPTSISLDMSTVSDKEGCYRYNTNDGLKWKFEVGTEITFDAEWENCEEIWTAPIWHTPDEWREPQGLTGEIDLIESCRSHRDETFTTSIICDDQPTNPKGDCYNCCYEPHWGSTSGGSGHFIGRVDPSGTFTLNKCTLGDHTNCELTAQYPNYLGLNHGTQHGDSFRFVSSLFNAVQNPRVDPGWSGCGTLNSNTNCKYTVANVAVKQGQVLCTPAGGDMYYHPNASFDGSKALGCCAGLSPVNNGGRMTCA